MEEEGRGEAGDGKAARRPTPGIKRAGHLILRTRRVWFQDRTEDQSCYWRQPAMRIMTAVTLPITSACAGYRTSLIRHPD